MATLGGQTLLTVLGEAGLGDWQGFPDGIRARFLSGTFTTGMHLIEAIGAAAEERRHHPDITLTFGHVDVRLVSHDAGGVTDRDVELARRISAIARSLDLNADRTAPAMLELALDTADRDEIAPFWSAVLTGEADNVDGDDVVDPTGRVPLLWFQETDPHEPPRQRFHLDVWVGADQAQARIAAALAAGGVVDDDSEAPSFTVLADAQGNRVCICTIADRGSPAQ